MSKKMLRHYELQDRIAEKLQALIIEMMLLGLMSDARMRERFRQQERIAELVTNAVFERVHLERKSLSEGLDFSKERRSPVRRLHRAVWKAPLLGFALSFLKNRDGGHQIERPLKHSVTHRRFFRATASPLRGFHGFELRVLAGNESGFV